MLVNTTGESKINVFHIDDDPLMRKLVRRLLPKDEFVVESAENGKEALKKLSNPHCGYQMVITEMLVSYTNGFEIINLVNSLNNGGGKNIPVIVMSNMNLIHMEEFIAVDPENFFKKPLVIEKFIFRVLGQLKGEITGGVLPREEESLSQSGPVQIERYQNNIIRKIPTPKHSDLVKPSLPVLTREMINIPLENTGRFSAWHADVEGEFGEKHDGLQVSGSHVDIEVETHSCGQEESAIISPDYVQLTPSYMVERQPKELNDVAYESADEPPVVEKVPEVFVVASDVKSVLETQSVPKEQGSEQPYAPFGSSKSNSFVLPSVFVERVLPMLGDYGELEREIGGGDVDVLKNLNKEPQGAVLQPFIHLNIEANPVVTLLETVETSPHDFASENIFLFDNLSHIVTKGNGVNTGELNAESFAMTIDDGDKWW